MTHGTLTANDAQRFSRVVYPPKGNPALSALENGVRGLFARVAEERRYYAIRNALQTRSDRVLADIGITRDDIPAFARRAAAGK